MTRFIFAIAVAFAIITPATRAYAQAPSAADLAKAKKAFVAGKASFDKGDFPEAASKFKESYNLSKKPTLLYNVGLANQSGGQDDIALFYFRKFLTDADPADPQRPDAEARVKELEKKFGGSTTPIGPVTPTEPVKVEPPKPEQHKEPTKLKPPGTYTDKDVQHVVVDTAPPKKPLDITAFVPEDSGFKVTLYYRTAGEGKFASKEMKWRYKELVGRVPVTKMIGESLQYYIEVKDPQSKDAVVTRFGKSTSPNLVELQPGAAERFYPDWNDDGVVATAAETKATDEDEDPLNHNKKKKVVVAQKTTDPDGIGPTPQPAGPGGGFSDVGSSKFKYMKWGSTATAGVLVGLSVLFYVQAGKQARALEADAIACGSPPCRAFNLMTDSYDKDLQDAGQRDQTLSRVTLVVGIGAAAIAGYYWYKELKAKKSGEMKVSGKNQKAPEASWLVSPSIGDGFAGAAAAARF